MWECEDSAECASPSERLCSPEAGGSVRWTATHGGLESKHRNRLQASEGVGCLLGRYQLKHKASVLSTLTVS